MAVVGDPYSFQLPPPNQGITMTGTVAKVDGEGNVLEAVPAGGGGGGSSSAGVSIYRAAMAGEETHVLPATEGGGVAAFAGGAYLTPMDFTTPIQATVHVPSNGMLLVYAEREYAAANSEDPTAGYSVETVLYHADLFPYLPDNEIYPPLFLGMASHVEADGAWRRSVSGSAGKSIDDVISPTEPPLARYNQSFFGAPSAFLVPGGDYTLALKWGGSHTSEVATAGATLFMRKWTAVFAVLAP